MSKINNNNLNTNKNIINNNDAENGVIMAINKQILPLTIYQHRWHGIDDCNSKFANDRFPQIPPNKPYTYLVSPNSFPQQTNHSYNNDKVVGQVHLDLFHAMTFPGVVPTELHFPYCLEIHTSWKGE